MAQEKKPEVKKDKFRVESRVITATPSDPMVEVSFMVHDVPEELDKREGFIKNAIKDCLDGDFLA